MVRTNYIFVDFENVPETEIERIRHKPAHVTIVLGERHKTLPVPLVKKMLSLPGQVELVENSRAGKNASDFILADQVGVRRAKDRDGFFHIIAKDRGYAALITHLRNEGLFAAQHDSLSAVPLLMNQDERLKYLLDGYGTSRLSRPGSRKGLESQIHHVFAHSVPDKDVEELIHRLAEAQAIRFSEDTPRVSTKPKMVAAA